MPPPSEHTVNATAGSLLGFLHWGPMTGWDLVAAAQLVIGDFWSLTRSQVYRELAAMDAAGLVAAGATGPRDRKPYALTDAGRAAFGEWVQREPGPENIRFPLLLTVAFGRHVPSLSLAQFLTGHRAQHAAKLAQYTAQHRAALDAGDADPFAMATLDFGLTYERAVLDWFDRLPPEMTGAAAAPMSTAPASSAGASPPVRFYDPKGSAGGASGLLPLDADRSEHQEKSGGG